MLTSILTVVHVVACVLLVLIVLLQSGKGSDLGAVFGGGASQTLFGPGGGKNILTKATTVLAVLFMFTSILLATLPYSANKSGSKIRDELAKEEASAVIPPVTEVTPENKQGVKGSTTKEKLIKITPPVTSGKSK